jgi:hypothetical protein
MVVGLLNQYPHQCILLSIAEFKSALSDSTFRNNFTRIIGCFILDRYRAKAMEDVYNTTIRANRDFKPILEAYIFIAKSLMESVFIVTFQQ